ncbi:hypothetical protein [Nocardioides halotolerans]|uniref:hypothetical protein n=1 Tax=Nocardioides halotolerans TaxID=433660 RepID=UPI000404E25A|nr:hypothetical protein [Nocardioides halotolerans]
MRDVLGVFAVAGRLFLRHWPALVTLSLLAGAVRNGAVWAATELSDVHGQLGQLVLLLAPLGFLVPVVVMLWVCRRSLPALRAVESAEVDVAPTERRPLRLVDVAVSLLVPFLAVYESLGLLDADLLRYRNAAAADNFIRAFGGDEVDDTSSRLAIYSLQVALLIVLGAWVLRWVLGRIERRVHLVALAFVGAFVELYYTVQLASQIVVLRTRGEPWLRDRVAARWVEDAYDAVVDALGPLGGAFGTLAGWVQQGVGSLDAVVVVPVGWMAFAAVVLGYRMATDEPEPQEAPDRSERQAPGLLRSFWADVRERWSALFDGLRLLLAAGLAPMLVLSLAILLVLSLPALVHPAVAAVIGPQAFNVSLAITPYEIAGGFALSLMLTAPLLAASVDYLVRTRTATRSRVAPTTPAPG